MSFSVSVGKELAAAPRPVLLYSFTFLDGTILRVSTLAVTFGGNAYTARVDDSEIERLATLSEQGVDRVPSVTVKLADPDGYLWTNYERATGRGFKGARLEARFALYDIIAAEWSTDSLVPFVGTCGQPDMDATHLTVQAASMLNLSRYSIPSVPIQQRCPWRNPTTAAQRVLAADPASPFYLCGETAAVAPCAYTKATCTQLLRFGGVTWAPPGTASGKSYLEGKVSWRNADTSGKFSERWPAWLGGTAWMECRCLNVVGDGNYTRGEVAVGFGPVTVERVILNGVSLDGSSTLGDFRWHYVNQGTRTGTPNADVPYNGGGDPYGNLTVIQVLAPRAVWSPDAEPSVRLLGMVGVSSPGGKSTPWVLQSALNWGNVPDSDLNTASFSAAAVICDEMIDYIDQNGTAGHTARFGSSVAIRERRPVAEIVRGLRQSIGGILVPNSAGKVELLIEGPLAEQQPGVIDGSNHLTPVSSSIRDGNTRNGYVAYSFDDANAWALRRVARPISESPNRVSFAFQDPTQGYAISTFSLVDPDDMERLGGQEQPGGLQVEPEGIASYNHALRCAKLGLAKVLRGNPDGDTRGTDWWEWKTSFRGCKLKIGQIVYLSSVRLGVTNQLVRLTEIKPERGFLTVTLRGHYHADAWYMDSFGNDDDPEYSAKHRDRLARPAYPWQPNYQGPITSDALRPSTYRTFGLYATQENDAAGVPVTELHCTGVLPVNVFSEASAPLIATQATTATTGGTVGPGRYYLTVCGVDAGGRRTAPSFVTCRADVAAGTSTNTVTIAVTSWGAATAGYEVFGGANPNRKSLVAAASGTPDSITVTAMPEWTSGEPDVEFDRLFARVKYVWHSGILGTAVSVVATNALTIGGTWTANALDGYVVSLLARASGAAVSVANYEITANTTDGVLSVTPDPDGEIVAGDVIVVRSLPVVSGATIGDALWVNPFSVSGMTADEEIGRLVRVVGGADEGSVYRIVDNTDTVITLDRDFAGDATSIVIAEDPTWYAEAKSGSHDNGDPAAETFIDVQAANLAGSTWLVQVVALDGGTSMGFESLAPVREIYVPGDAGNTTQSEAIAYPS